MKSDFIPKHDYDYEEFAVTRRWSRGWWFACVDGKRKRAFMEDRFVPSARQMLAGMVLSAMGEECPAKAQPSSVYSANNSFATKAEAWAYLDKLGVQRDKWVLNEEPYTACWFYPATVDFEAAVAFYEASLLHPRIEEPMGEGTFENSAGEPPSQSA
jgi:hypothetical protein